MESIEIGNECFESVQTFKIDGLNRLKSLKIGRDSFTQLKNVVRKRLYYTLILAASHESKSFHILNCESLESIEIGSCSFCDFGGEFELRNLNSLQLIKIGEIGNKSFNFCSSTFVIRGRIMILNTEYLDLPNLQFISLGNSVFNDSISTVIESIG